MKSRLLAYAVIILLAGYFYSDYAKAEQSDNYCLGYTEQDWQSMCRKGDVIRVIKPRHIRLACDFSYQVVDLSDTTWMCIYRGEIRTNRFKGIGK